MIAKRNDSPAPQAIGNHQQGRAICVSVRSILNGFHEAFGKTGLDFSRPARPVRVEFKAPLELDYGAEPRQILAQVMDAIEQSDAHRQPDAIDRDCNG